MSNPFIGEIRMVGFTFAPRGWALCNGQIMSIAQNTALFSLLGTTYGGNGQTTFALPDLRGRVPIHFGQGPGLSSYVQGEVAGTENVTLLQAQIPAHTHTVACSSDDPTTADPNNAFPSTPTTKIYASSATAGRAMNPGILSIIGGNQPHSNLQPFLVINFCIALEGIFPSRN